MLILLLRGTFDFSDEEIILTYDGNTAQGYYADVQGDNNAYEDSNDYEFDGGDKLSFIEKDKTTHVYIRQ